jgi:hypothetical protein
MTVRSKSAPAAAALHGLDKTIPVLSWEQVRDIQVRFKRLSPFDTTVVPEVLKAERNSLERELWCYAISA